MDVSINIEESQNKVNDNYLKSFLKSNTFYFE